MLANLADFEKVNALVIGDVIALVPLIENLSTSGIVEWIKGAQKARKAEVFRFAIRLESTAI